MEPFPSQVLWSVGAPVLCHAQLASSFLTGSLSSETFVDYACSLWDVLFLRGSPGGPWYDRDSPSSTAKWPRPPGSLMAPLTRWSREMAMSSAPVVSLVSLHVGLTWVSFKGPPPQDGEGLGPSASRSTAGCKPGRGSRSTHKGGRREVSVRLSIFVAALFVRYSSVQVAAAYSRHTEAYVGRTWVVRRRTGERTQYAVSTRTISSRVVFLWVLSRFSQLSRSR